MAKKEAVPDTTFAGYLADLSGIAIVFIVLACISIAGLLFVLAFMPETRGNAPLVRT